MTWAASASSWSLSSRQQEAIKWVAIAVMVLDHVAVAFLVGDAYVLARSVGRMAYPLFGFLLAYNLVRWQVQPRKYYRPLLVLAVVSQVPYAFLFPAAGLNIFAELFIGVLLVDAVQRRSFSLSALAVGLAALYVVYGGGYGVAGLLLIPAWALALRRPTVAALGGLAVVLWSLSPGHPGQPLAVASVLLVGLVAQLPAGFGVGRVPRWFYYAFYPAHLLALVFLSGPLLFGVSS